MCDVIGVDALASRKGFWSELFGNIGDYYYELGVRIVEVCIATREKNGGLIALEELTAQVRARMAENAGGRLAQGLELDDVRRSIRTLGSLGSGFELVQASGRTLVRSVPTELSHDHTAIFDTAAATGWVTVDMLAASLGWEEHRAVASLSQLVQEGMVWLDEQHAGGTAYWFPGLVQG